MLSIENKQNSYMIQIIDDQEADKKDRLIKKLLFQTLSDVKIFLVSVFDTFTLAMMILLNAICNRRRTLIFGWSLSLQRIRLLLSRFLHSFSCVQEIIFCLVSFFSWSCFKTWIIMCFVMIWTFLHPIRSFLIYAFCNYIRTWSSKRKCGIFGSSS